MGGHIVSRPKNQTSENVKLPSTGKYLETLKASKPLTDCLITSEMQVLDEKKKTPLLMGIQLLDLHFAICKNGIEKSKKMFNTQEIENLINENFEQFLRLLEFKPGNEINFMIQISISGLVLVHKCC